MCGLLVDDWMGRVLSPQCLETMKDVFCLVRQVWRWIGRLDMLAYNVEKIPLPVLTFAGGNDSDPGW